MRNDNRKGADKMSDQPKVLVIEYGKESFVRHGEHYSDRDRLIVNGSREWPKAVGDEAFLVVPGKVKSVERYNAPLTVTVRYALREDLACAAKQPWVTPEEFNRLPEADRVLFTRITEQREQKPEPREWMVVDGKAAPRKIPAGIKPVLPHHVNTYPWFWWTLRCQASREFIFAQLTKRVEALDPSQFAVTVYTNISHMRVEARAFTLGGVEFRPSTYLLYVDREKGGIPTIEGDGLDDVLKQVDAFCDKQMEAVDAALAVVACPCCKAKLPKGVKPKITARDPRHRIGHDISRH